MEDNHLLMLLIVIILILLSAFFSASETSYSSLNKIKLKHLIATKDKKAIKAETALNLSEQYDRLLSTILIGNNIVNIAATSISTVMFVSLYGDIGATISTVVITVVVLIFGEISPKTMAKENPERFAMFSAPILRFFIIILLPLNYLFGLWKTLILKLFRVKADKFISEQELLTYVEEVKNEGGINEREETMIKSAIEFDDLEAGDIITPRVDIQAIELGNNTDEITELFHETGYSRLPVYTESIDNIIGVILHKDFSYNVLKLGQDIESIIQPAVFETKAIRISMLLKELQRKKSHMAVIVDEYGGTLGIVTVEDIIEELVGDIWDEHDHVVQQVKKINDDNYTLLASTDIEDFFALFDMDEETNAATVGGWIIEHIGKIPEQNETFCICGLEITALKTEPNRIVEVSAKRLAQ